MKNGPPKKSDISFGKLIRQLEEQLRSGLPALPPEPKERSDPNEHSEYEPSR